MVKAIYYTLGSKFAIEKTEMFQNAKEAIDSLRQHGQQNGFTRIQEVDDEDYSIRITATTPNGRSGRNIGCIELGW